MSKLLFVLLLGGISLAVVACKEGQGNVSTYTDQASCTTATDTVTYTGTVAELINNSCAYAGCHSTSSKAGGVKLGTYADAKSEFANGDALCTIYHDCKPMPEGSGKLPQSEIDLLTCWVKNGCAQ
jgi:hypothetical protein